MIQLSLFALIWFFIPACANVSPRFKEATEDALFQKPILYKQFFYKSAFLEIVLIIKAVKFNTHVICT